MPKSFSEILAEQNKSALTQAQGPDESPIQQLDSSPAEHAKAEQEELENPGATGLGRFTHALINGGNRAARDYHMQSGYAHSQRIAELNEMMPELQARVDAGEENAEFTLDHTMRELNSRKSALMETSTALVENEHMRKSIAAGAARKSKLHEDAMAEDASLYDVWQAIKEDPGMITDLLGENAPMLAANAAVAFATKGRNAIAKAGQVAGQAFVEGGITSMQELTEIIDRDYGDSIDLTNPDSVNAIFENADELMDAHNKSIKAGIAGGIGSILSTKLANRGIVDIDTLAKTPIRGAIKEASGQGVAQAAIGVGTEYGIAAGAERDVSAFELAAGGGLGVASGAIDAASSSRSDEAAVRRQELDAEARAANPDSSGTPDDSGYDAAGTASVMTDGDPNTNPRVSPADRLITSINKIYNTTQVDTNPEIEAAKTNLDTATQEFDEIRNRSDATPEEVAAARLRAVASRKDYNSKLDSIEEQQARPSAEDEITQAADSMPDDAPELAALRETDAQPKSRFDVPESDERYQAAQDYQSETDVVAKDAALSRFENPEIDDGVRQERQDGVQQRQGEEGQENVQANQVGRQLPERHNQDGGLEEGRLEGQPIDSGRSGQRGNEEGLLSEEGRGIQSGREELEQADSSHAAHELLRASEPSPETGRVSDTSSPRDKTPDVSTPSESVRAGDSPLQRANAKIESLYNSQEGRDLSPEDFAEKLSAAKREQEVERKALNDYAENMAARSNGNVKVVDNWQNLPPKLRAILAAGGEGKTSQTFGFYDGVSDKVYILMDTLNSKQSIRELLIHEASHSVRNGKPGSKFDATEELNKLYELLGGTDEAVVEYAKSRGIDDMAHYFDTLAGSANRGKLLTDELLAQIHGRETGELKQLARRVLSKIENAAKAFGIELNMFKKNGEIDEAVQRELARTERLIRNNGRLGKSVIGVVAPMRNESYSRLVTEAFKLSDESAARLRDIEARIGDSMSQDLRNRIRNTKKAYWDSNRGITDDGFAARVMQLGQQALTSMRMNAMKVAYDRSLKGVSKSERVELSKIARNYLADDTVDISKLPKDTQDVVRSMRDTIDKNSVRISGVLTEQISARLAKEVKKHPHKETEIMFETEMLRQEVVSGVDPQDIELENYPNVPSAVKRQLILIQTLHSNQGQYLNTSYEAFDPRSDYYKRLKSDPELFEKYVGWIQDISEEQTGKRIDSNEARGKLKKMLKDAGTGSDHQEFITSGGSIAGINKSQFRQKHLSDPRMKEILGEYTDVMTNFQHTINAQEGIVTNHEFQKKLLTSLEDAGMLSDKAYSNPDGYLELNEPLMVSDEMSVLNGHFSTPVVTTALETFRDQMILPALLRHLNLLTSKVNYGLTVLSPPTAIMNVANNYYIRAASGHALYRKQAEQAGKEVKIPSVKEIRKILIASRKGDPDAIKEIEELVAAGIASESVVLREYSELINSQDELVKNWWGANIMTAENPGKVVTGVQATTAVASKIKNFAEDFYSDGDDIFKIESYYIEKHKAENFLFPESDFDMKNADDVKRRADLITQHAVGTTRRQHLMYTETNRAVGIIRKTPLFGQFVSFPAALARATKEQIKLAAEDMTNEKLPKNMRAARFMGLLTTTLAPSTIAMVSGMIAGMSDEEEDALRQTLPEWARQNTIMWMGEYDNGDPRYYDLSRLNPYEYFLKSFKHLTKSNEEGVFGIGGNLQHAAHELASPFYMPAVATAAATELMTGIRLDSGSRIANRATSNDQQAFDRGLQFVMDILPGGAAQAVNIFNSATNDAKWFGGENSLLQTTLNATGVGRVNRLDADVAFQFKIKDYQRMRGAARQILGRTVNSLEGVPDYAEVKEALFTRYEAENKNAQEMLTMVKVMRDLGMDDDKLRLVLKSKGTSITDIEAFMGGTLPVLGLTGRETDSGYATAQGQVDNEEDQVRIDAERKERKEMLRAAHDEWIRLHPE